MSSEVVWSKITAIELHNFMSHKDTRLEFDESNIIDLCGYNDSGKTAVEFALDVLLYDSSPTLQSSYIREGEDFFNVALEFEDGVKISKTKDTSGKSIWLMAKNGVVIYTNKKDTNIIATDGVPQEIAKYLGVIYDEVTEQKLNLRTKRDRALLTDTTGGENYKMLSAICNSEVLSDASGAMTDKRNKLNQDINTKATTLTAYHNQYVGIDVPPDSEIDVLHNNIVKAKECKAQLDMLETVYQCNEQLKNSVVYDNISELRYDKLNCISSIISLKDILNEPIIPETLQVDYTRLGIISTCVKAFEEISQANVAPELNTVNNGRLKSLIDVIKSYNEYNKQYSDYYATEQQYNNVVHELKTLCQTNNVRICDNCGAAVLDKEVGLHEHV